MVHYKQNSVLCARIRRRKEEHIYILYTDTEKKQTNALSAEDIRQSSIQRVGQLEIEGDVYLSLSYITSY